MNRDKLQSMGIDACLKAVEIHKKDFKQTSSKKKRVKIISLMRECYGVCQDLILKDLA